MAAPLIRCRAFGIQGRSSLKESETCVDIRCTNMYVHTQTGVLPDAEAGEATLILHPHLPTTTPSSSPWIVTCSSASQSQGCRFTWRECRSSSRSSGNNRLRAAPKKWRDSDMVVAAPSKHELSGYGPSLMHSHSVAISALGDVSAPSPESEEDSSSASDQSVRNLALTTAAAALLIVGAGAAFTVANGGPGAITSIFSKSGFTAAFSLIFASEIGDKTFFIAALLAMRHNRGLVLTGSCSALALMTVISVMIGRLFRQVPSQLHTTIPVGEYLAIALLVWFGIRSIFSALELPAMAAAEGVDSDGGELAEAQEFVEKAEANQKVFSSLDVLWEAFTLVFVAEWGDRSMLATIALGAAQSPVGVALGAIWGHVLATALAVVGGSFLARYISERTVGLVGGVLFLLFAVATLLGVF